MEQYTKCHLCNADDYKILFTKPMVGRIVKCNRCNFMYVNPYELESWVDLRKNTSSEQEPDLYLQKLVNQKGDHKEMLKEINKIKSNGRLLEIGCFTAHFLSLCKLSGYRVIGVEPDTWSANYAREKFNIEVYNSLLEEIDFDDSSFDIVVMNHVLEHLRILFPF